MPGKLSKKMERTGVHSDVKGQNRSPPNQSPRIRVVGSRIYDSVNGKSCHQCRQKTRDFSASCKNLKNDKLCSINYCYKCLLNRYGEKAEEMALLENWICPKCRNICNCSFCRKKIGCSPTGILVHTAKATGFSSVSEMLQAVGPGSICKNVKDKVCSPKDASPNKESLVVYPRKRGKENSFDGKEGSNLCPQDEATPKKVKREDLKLPDSSAALKKRSSKRPRITQQMSKDEVKTDGKDDDVLQENGSGASVTQKVSFDSNVADRKGKQGAKQRKVGVEDNATTDNAGAKPNKLVRCHKVKNHTMKLQSKEFDIDLNVPVSHDPIVVEDKEEERGCTQNMGILDNAGAKPNKVVKAHKDKKHETEFQRKESNVDVPISRDSYVMGEKGVGRDCKTCQNVGVFENVIIDNAVANPDKVAKSQKVKKQRVKFQPEEFGNGIPLPQATSLTTVAGVELSPKDVGHALQFVEFCAAFGKVFGIRKGQSESVLQELVHGYNGPQGRHSVTAQLHIKLLTLILKDLGQNSQPLTSTKGKSSWLKALGDCISTSSCALEEIPSDCFERGSEGYDALDFSKKLRILNFLCDESLCTERLRRYIDNQNSKFVGKEKAAKEKVLAAKDKTKCLKHKLLDERVRIIIAQKGAPISISKQEAVFAHLKTEVEQANADTLEAINILSQMKPRSDAVRTEPIFSDVNGHSFWRLKACNGGPDIVLQDMATWIADAPDEKWFSYDHELKISVEEYISIREKKLKFQRVTKSRATESNEAQSLHNFSIDLD